VLTREAGHQVAKAEAALVGSRLSTQQQVAHLQERLRRNGSKLMYRPQLCSLKVREYFAFDYAVGK